MQYRITAALAAAVLSLSVACSRPLGPPVNLPPPVTSTAVGVGDKVDVAVLGEKELSTEYEIDEQGNIRFPYVPKPLHVAGLRPTNIADLIRDSLIESKYLTNPQVLVKVKEYNSRKVTIIGAVSKPGPIVWTEGLKIIDAISQAGWFTPLAESDRVVLTRRVEDKTVTAYINVEEISSGRQPNLLLQAGDTIKVDQRAW